jgi:uncharacterized protein (DUF305 family)
MTGGAGEGTTSGRSDPPRWLLIAVGVLAAAALAFGIGRFTAFGVGSGAAAGMPTTDSADAGFARDMQVHHAQAVDMAMTIYRTTDDDELRTLAYDIATGQASQSGRLYELLVQWGLPQAGGPLMAWMTSDEHAGHGGGTTTAKTDAELRAEMGMATDAELARLDSASGQPADCLFLSLMIRHHEGAIAMVDAVLERGQAVTGVARSMKQTQAAEVVAMQQAQERLGCSR